MSFVARIPIFEGLLQDIRFGLRVLKRRPGASIVIVAVLALGIGVNSAMFSIVDAVLLRPLPYRDGDRMVMISQSSPQHRTTGEWFNYYSQFEAWQRTSHSFENLSALTWALGGKSLLWQGRRQEVLPIPVSASFFSMLSVSAERGRTFQDSDFNEGCSVVLAHSFWQQQLGAAADIVGKSVPIDQSECRVLGVMPKDFSFYPLETSMWMLITPDSELMKNPWRSPTGVIGRLKPGVTRAAAEAELEGLERSIRSEAPTDVNFPQAVPVVLDLRSEFTWLTGRNLRTALIVLFGAVFFVLLIACVNVANLLLAQAADRQKEFAVRASLGAPRGRLMRQLLVESALLSTVGALLGALLAFCVVQLFRAKNPIQLPPGNPVQVNAQVLVFTVLLAIASVVLFGLLPAWRASRLNLSEAIKESSQNLSQSGTAKRTGFVLVAAEVGLSLVLLTGAGLLIQSLARLAATPLGFRTDHLLTASVRLPKSKYSDDDRKTQFFRQLTEQIGALPGVNGVTVGSSFNLLGSSLLSVEGRQFSREHASLDTASETIDDEFLHVLGIPLLRGRAFDSRDRSTTEQVALINQALGDRYFANQDPLGQHIKLAPPDSKDPWLTIVGVVGNVKTNTVFQEMAYIVPPGVYQPLSQQPASSMSILIRTKGDPNALATPLAQTLLALDSDVTLANVKTMNQRLAERESQPRFRTILLSAFAVLALVLATLGIYGVLTQAVVRRTGEIGVRMALGASRQRVMHLILRQAFGAVAMGIVAGTIATLFLVRLAKGLLYDVNPDNPFTLTAVAALLVVVAAVASYLPARRATTIDPLNALRRQ